MGHGNTDVFESSDSGSVVSSRQREGPPDSSVGWTPGNFEGFLLDTCFAPESVVCVCMLLEVCSLPGPVMYMRSKCRLRY